MKRKKYLFSIVACGIMIFTGCSQNINRIMIQAGEEEKTATEMITTEECTTEEITTEEVTTEEPYEVFDSFELIDYAVLVRIMSQEKGEIAACDLLDVDQDGKKELFVENGSCGQISRDYGEHLKVLGYHYIAKTGDIDNDEAEEYCYFVEDYAKPWREHLNSLNELEEENFVQGSDNAVSVVVIDKQGDTVVVRTAYAEQSVGLKEVEISDEIKIMDDEAVSVYRLDGDDNLVFQSRRYNGKIMDIVRNNRLYVPGRQSPFWQEFSFYENGEMVCRNVSVNEEIVYSEERGTYRVDEKTSTLYFQLEDDWETKYVFVESEWIFDGGVGTDYLPDGNELPVRYFMVPCKEFPTEEQLYQFYEYYNWNIEN